MDKFYVIHWLKKLEIYRAQTGSENFDFDDIDEGVVLKTIKIPKNILNLSEKLPELNYKYNLVIKKIRKKK